MYNIDTNTHLSKSQELPAKGDDNNDPLIMANNNKMFFSNAKNFDQIFNFKYQKHELCDIWCQQELTITTLSPNLDAGQL